jgi:hypothetical protein
VTSSRADVLKREERSKDHWTCQLRVYTPRSRHYIPLYRTALWNMWFGIVVSLSEYIRYGLPRTQILTCIQGHLPVEVLVQPAGLRIISKINRIPRSRAWFSQGALKDGLRLVPSIHPWWQSMMPLSGQSKSIRSK